MRSPHLGLGRGRDGTYYEMLVDRLEFNNNQYVQGVLNRDWDVCNVIHCIGSFSVLQSLLLVKITQTSRCSRDLSGCNAGTTLSLESSILEVKPFPIPSPQCFPRSRPRSQSSPLFPRSGETSFLSPSMSPESVNSSSNLKQLKFQIFIRYFLLCRVTR